ncbi:DUF5958 family protein [Dyadobacter sp. CY343]|uniref:DUF5958 family protein n=1 Tax=Dyadobacter sp. CY343 TaxID=2907299 RepID=UPI001F158FAD|nr:DUF5958 family protein [Dyadobacter sp. CY343]MCE7060690.1 DUF5958 family protein [Dyadobacter sp. CY343]
MLQIKDSVALNKYGQDILNIEDLLKPFSEWDILERKNYLKEVVALILQSKPKEQDIEPAIINSNLKATYTPCVLLKKGIANHNLEKLINLPENELTKALVLLLSLFRIAYKRRFAVEKENSDKWWYWDLSDEANVSKILKNYK